MSRPQTKTKNAWNAILMIAVGIPPVALAVLIFESPDEGLLADFQAWHPLLLANLLFFGFVTIGFWLLSLVQRSTWLIDPYWTFIPVLLAHFFAGHPTADGNPMRSAVALVFVWAWSIRLTHSYFRREEWQFGTREDWRFTQYRTRYGRHFWWKSFFVTYASQQLMLVGLCLPLWAIQTTDRSWTLWDSLATTLCVAGIAIAYFADTQLREFMLTKEEKRKRGEHVDLILEQGLWRLSRHPNYFGEQLWWWGLAIFAVPTEHYWVLVGPAFNSACMLYVTILTERRMLARPERAPEFRAYQTRTSMWIPWPRRPHT